MRGPGHGFSRGHDPNPTSYYNLKTVFSNKLKFKYTLFIQERLLNTSVQEVRKLFPTELNLWAFCIGYDFITRPFIIYYIVVSVSWSFEHSGYQGPGLETSAGIPA